MEERDVGRRERTGERAERIDMLEEGGLFLGMFGLMVSEEKGGLLHQGLAKYERLETQGGGGGGAP